MTTAVFLGTPEAALPALRALADLADVRAVVTRPSRARGRGRRTQPTPVAVAATHMGISVHTPATRAELAALDVFAVDVAVVVAFGMIIPGDILTVPRVGFLNLHFSLLPRWRGAAPVERAILAGDPATGVCLMQMDEGLDTGGIIACRQRPVDRLDAGAMTALLATDGAALLGDVLPGHLSGMTTVTPQSGEPTHASRLRTGEGLLAVGDPTDELDRRIRAFTPRPGAWFDTDAGRLKVWSADPVPLDLGVGQWAYAGDDVLVGTGDGALRLREVQAEGARRMAGSAWANGRRGDFPVLVR